MTVEQAQAAMNALADNLAQQYPVANNGWGIKVEPRTVGTGVIFGLAPAWATVKTGLSGWLKEGALEESRPVFFGKAMRLHHSFNDPAAVEGSEEERLDEFRRVRDELWAYLKSFGFAPP
jgi:hypothetical protein